jgi:uncharacterized membrane protein
MRVRPGALHARTALIAVVVLSGVMLFASLASKAPCAGPPYDAQGYSTHLDNSYRLLCLTDIQYLWVGRGLDHDQFPYVHGALEPGDGPPGVLTGGAVEYPVLTGVFMWLAALPAANSTQFMVWTALMLLPVALAIGWMLARLVGWRALIWAAAPALVFYSVYNWDLLPVAWTVGAVLAWKRGRTTLAAACLGLGAATKIYPGFFLLPLVIERLVARDRRGAALAAAAGAGGWLLPNAPFMLINVKGWWATYAFQAGRVPTMDTNSIYYWGLPDWPLPSVDRLSITLIAYCWLIAVAIGLFFPPPGGKGYPWLQVGAAMLFSFLAFNKVYSPQYMLWVLPLLALIRVRWGWWLACWALDATLFIGLIRWFNDYGDDLSRQAAIIGGWGKTVLLMLLFFAVLRAPALTRPRTDADSPVEVRVEHAHLDDPVHG